MPINRGVITHPFDEMRPVEGPKTHKHGAVDVARGDMQAIMPVSGTARAMVFLRGATPWASNDKPEIMDIPARNYFYDTFGGMIEILADDGTYHLLCHFWPSDLQRRFGRLEYIESEIMTRTPCVALIGDPVHLMVGARLCPIGGAGYVQGDHIHWEIHHKVAIEDYASRVNPESLLIKG